jgi:hypothetical protein
VPKDSDVDGAAEGVVYYGADPAKPLAVGELSQRHLEPVRLLLLDNQQDAQVIWRDHDGDGQLDERTTYSGGDASNLIIDVDSDWRPDVQVDFQDGQEFARYPLSGRMLMVMDDGVVGDMWLDIFSKADAYVKLFHNYELKFVSDTVSNSNFPIWNQGVVVHFRHGDRIGLELWDQDVITSDDLIDEYSTSSLPSSGIYRFDGGKAAIRMSVTPSELPEGHEVYMEAPDVEGNYFLDHPSAVEEYGELIAMAEADAVRAQVMQVVAKGVVFSVIAKSSPNPVQNRVLGFIARLVMDQVM